ncbi:hypothetical protein W03_19580 [Nitrosomonas sp. PY1]|uniref:hypothetical protein n=1 Tax=Nitrosomonas sp. PY1 TaxID=1803906 RepID=UPI001FC863E9|nr:hypothetical protein [Nitrosomonas sp. PY1]GKS69954.1 hypothetical protein W03_19580 [Nitrosomonas sp. PY1]
MKTFFAFLSMLPLIAACSGPSKGQLDDEVRRLCAIDGGIKVYETVKLPAGRFDKYGQIRIPYKEIVGPGDRYFYESSQKFLVEGNPAMWRNHYKVFRIYDNKILGESVSYARRGGDLPGPWHGTSFGCPEKASIIYLNMQIFIKE